MGKSIGAGSTLGAFMGRAEIMDCLPAPAHLFTLGGNAIACAAGNAAFDYDQSEEFQTLYKRNCADIQKELAGLKEKHPDKVAFYRGRGMSWAIGIVKKDEKGNTIPPETAPSKSASALTKKDLSSLPWPKTCSVRSRPSTFPKKTFTKPSPFWTNPSPSWKKEKSLTASSSTATAGKDLPHKKTTASAVVFLFQMRRETVFPKVDAPLRARGSMGHALTRWPRGSVRTG